MFNSRLLVVVFLIGIAIRLIHITQPYVDAWSYRQSDVATIAENFYSYGYDLLHPQINWAGNVPGYVGTEFPLIPFTASILYAFFGVHEWIGRSISVFFFALSVPYLYLLFRKFLSDQAAVLGITIYMFLPLGIFSSRSFMPDTAALCFTIMSLYYFSEWQDQFENRWMMAVSIATGTIALLLKPASLAMGLPMMFLAHRKWGIQFLSKQQLWTFLLIPLAFASLWYVHAFTIGLVHPPYHMFGEGTNRLVSGRAYWEILKTTSLSALTLPVTATVLVGIIISVISRGAKVFLFWFAAVVLFVIIFGSGNKAHAWYRLPFLPVAAAFSGIALEGFWNLIRTRSLLAARVLMFIFFLLYGNESHRVVSELYQPAAASLARLGEKLRIVTAPSDLIVMVDHGDPTGFYYAKRKGWHFLPRFGHRPGKGRTAIRELEKLQKLGATHFAIPSHELWWLEYYKDFGQHLETNYRRIHRTENFSIYDLSAGKTARTKNS